MVYAKDGGSLLRDSHRTKLIQLVKTLQNNVTVDYEGKVRLVLLSVWYSFRPTSSAIFASRIVN